MQNPFVSVIIPNYNHAIFLDERIQSVLNQTYRNFEIIILDDKSTDNSLEIINKYKDNPYISSIVMNTENSGSTFKQWHKGFELAKGEIVWIAESDDSCEKSLLETLVRGYVDNKAVIAFSRSCKYDIEGNKTPYLYQPLISHDKVLSGVDFLSQYMIEYNSVANASSAIFNKNVAMSIGRQYMKMQAEGDYLFWIELMEQGTVFFCSQVLNFFRFHKSNTTKSMGSRGISAIEHKIIFDYLKEHNYMTSSVAKIERLKFVDYLMRSDFESFTARIKVLHLWDKYKYWRLYIIFSCLKEDIKIFFKNII